MPSYQERPAPCRCEYINWLHPSLGSGLKLDIQFNQRKTPIFAIRGYKSYQRSIFIRVRSILALQISGYEIPLHGTRMFDGSLAFQVNNQNIDSVIFPVSIFSQPFILADVILKGIGNEIPYASDFSI